MGQKISKSDRYCSVSLITNWLQKQHITIPESTAWDRIDKIVYSRMSSHPHPYKGDTAKQEEFKKGPRGRADRTGRL
ncbi:MAG: hypothetical protein HGA33_06150 [Candidatus Moranbacteria bacterium]|nr:hypothetical protein [Candidatus Moranbacteria bacterium]